MTGIPSGRVRAAGKIRSRFQNWPAAITLLILFFLTGGVFSQQRFPKPEFESGHVVPAPTTPAPRQNAMEILDVAVLFTALVLAGYFAHKKRSRKALFILMVFSLIYFGFWRKGCVCSVGSLQNITLALFDQGYVIPVTVVAFFVLPLIFTLFFGRTFCSSVCPLGAIQDIVVLRPLVVPHWLESVLGLVPVLYLGLGILLAATGADFLICRLDPFVGIFRFSADFAMVLFGVSFLVLGIFIARPYCRFLCPYGVLLNWMSRLSRSHVTITPAECIQCRLCEDSCPFGAIRMPVPEKSPEKRRTEIRRLTLILELLPFLVFGGGWLGSALHGPLSATHARVRLAEQIRMEESGLAKETTLESRTFQSMGTPTEDLYREAEEIDTRFRKGGWFLGGFFGFVMGLSFLGLAIRRKQTDYVPDRGRCLSCGRCFSYCPVRKKE